MHDTLKKFNKTVLPPAHSCQLHVAEGVGTTCSALEKATRVSIDTTGEYMLR